MTPAHAVVFALDCVAVVLLVVAGHPRSRYGWGWYALALLVLVHLAYPALSR